MFLRGARRGVLAMVAACVLTRAPTARGQTCTGDCDGSGTVTIAELLTMVNIALGNAPVSACAAGDADHNGSIMVNEILLAVTAALGGCRASLSGTVSMGAPVANATVSVKDRTGSSVTATTDAQGTYAADVTGLMPPFLLRVDAPDRPLFSVGVHAGVANVTPITDLIVRTFYRVLAADAGSAFDNLSTAVPLPSADTLHIMSTALLDILGRWLANAGVEADTFDPIQTPFRADGTGVDAVLGRMVESADGSSLSLRDDMVGVSQRTTFSVDTVAGSLTATTAATSTSGTTSSIVTTLLPVSAPVQEALRQAQALLAQFTETVNRRGQALTDADLLQGLASDYLNDGDDRAISAAETADFLRGKTILAADPIRILAYNDPDKVIRLLVRLRVVVAATETDSMVELSFKSVNGTWVSSGNRRLAKIDLQAENRLDLGATSSSGFQKTLNVQVQAPVATITAVTISGGGVFDADALINTGQIVVTRVHPTPTTTLDIQRATFSITSSALSAFPEPGTQFAVTVVPVVGDPVSYVIATAATTTDTISLSGPAGSRLADAKLGQPLNVSWTLPTTFPAKRISLAGLVLTAVPGSGATGFACQVGPPIVIGPTTVSATITLPATCNGQAVVSANLYLAIDGPNGERITIVDTFQDS